MITLTIRTRIIAWFLTLAVFLLALSSLLLYLDTYRTAYRALDRLLASRALAYGSMVEYDKGRFEFETGEAAYFQPDSGKPWRGFAIYQAGNREPIFISPSFSSRRPLSEALAFVFPETHRHSLTVSKTFHSEGGAIRVHAGLYPARQEPEIDDSETPGQVEGPRVLVVTAESQTAVEARLKGLFWRLLGTSLLSLAVAAVFGRLLSSRIVAPLTSMAGTAARIQANDLHEHIPIGGSGDEIDHLATTLNAAFDRLGKALESQSRFTANAAHEVRTPVAVIRAQAESTLRVNRSPEEYRQTITRVLESATRLQELVEGLLLLSRADSRKSLGQLENISLVTLAGREMDRRAEEAARRSLALDLQTADPVMISGDRRLVEIAIGNLLENAIRFSVDPGRIMVIVESMGEFAELTVEDEGPGIEDEHLRHIFDRFYTANTSRSRQEGGAGLGLSIVQTIARLHGGSLIVSSTPGEGSRFTLRLPHDPRSGQL